MNTKPVMERFLNKIKINTKTGCWEWQAALNSEGYGGIWVQTRTIKAHRFAYEKYIGPIPKDTSSYHGICVLHKCDNRKGVNPFHLFLGTNLDNILDMRNKNRNPKGTDYKSAKLNESQVIEIRKLYRTGNYSKKKLAKMFNIGDFMIGSIVHRKLWKHI